LEFSRAKKRNRKSVWFLQNDLSQTRRNESFNVKFQCLHDFVNKAKIKKIATVKSATKSLSKGIKHKVMTYDVIA